MHNRILKRAGGVLLAVGVIDAALTIYWLGAGSHVAEFDLVPIVLGILLLRGSLRAALWIRTIAVFTLAAAAVFLIGVPFFQPLDLTLTEIRLDPVDFAAVSAKVIVILCAAFWITRVLGRPEVRDATAGAGIRRWDMRIPAQVGGGLVALVGLLLWLALHGQSAELATSLALQQLGPDYRYHLSSISSTSNGHGTSVTGVVTAWNDKEIKKVLLHWETR